MAEYLEGSYTDRGFLWMPPLRGGTTQVEVYESSADTPKLWLAVSDLRTGARTVAHLRLDTARRLAEQIEHVLAHHRLTEEGDRRLYGPCHSCETSNAECIRRVPAWCCPDCRHTRLTEEGDRE